jgi:LPS export ABC transporter protein LptC
MGVFANIPRFKPAVFLALLFALAACTFDYGMQELTESGLPDIVMEDVEYVRVRSADPVARFQAKRVERYEQRRLMELQNLTFEQFGSHGEEINAFGSAGLASVEIDSGNIRLSGGVRVEVESEDLSIETNQLEWKDKERLLSAGEFEQVSIYQSNGTGFTGVGFHADIRRRSWEFSGGVNGAYVFEDEEEDAGDNADGGLEGERAE